MTTSRLPKMANDCRPLAVPAVKYKHARAIGYPQHGSQIVRLIRRAGDVAPLAKGMLNEEALRDGITDGHAAGPRPG